MSKPTLRHDGRRIILSFRDERSARKFIIDTAGAIQKIGDIQDQNKMLKDQVKSLESAVEMDEETFFDQQEKICFLENELQAKTMECEFLRGQLSPAKEAEPPKKEEEK